jgi:hypothetical protein
MRIDSPHEIVLKRLLHKLSELQWETGFIKAKEKRGGQ